LQGCYNYISSDLPSPQARKSNMMPVSKDGSRFDAVTCRRRFGYQVGPKGDEQKFASFEDASAALAIMVPPRWRRPNAAGNWGLVTGKHWEP
jgi:hypothetical protein